MTYAVPQHTGRFVTDMDMPGQMPILICVDKTVSPLWSLARLLLNIKSAIPCSLSDSTNPWPASIVPVMTFTRHILIYIFPEFLNKREIASLMTCLTYTCFRYAIMDSLELRTL